jgi:hypothetical protein
VARGDLLSYLRSSAGSTLVAYSPLLSGAYVPTDRPLGPEFDHAGTSARLSGITEPLIVLRRRHAPRMDLVGEATRRNSLVELDRLYS